MAACSVNRTLHHVEVIRHGDVRVPAAGTERPAIMDAKGNLTEWAVRFYNPVDRALGFLSHQSQPRRSWPPGHAIPTAWEATASSVCCYPPFRGSVAAARARDPSCRQSTAEPGDPIEKTAFEMAGAEGFEPSALGFGDRCSDQTELRPYAARAFY